MSRKVSETPRDQLLQAAHRAGFLVLRDSIGIISEKATFEARVLRKIIRVMVHGNPKALRRHLARVMADEFSASSDEEFKRDFEVPCYFLYGDFPEIEYGSRDVALLIRLLGSVRRILCHKHNGAMKNG